MNEADKKAYVDAWVERYKVRHPDWKTATKRKKIADGVKKPGKFRSVNQTIRAKARRSLAKKLKEKRESENGV